MRCSYKGWGWLDYNEMLDDAVKQRERRLVVMLAWPKVIPCASRYC